MFRKRCLSLALSASFLSIAGASIATPINLAYNPTRAGLPSPLASDPGWGGGSDRWSIVDGLNAYDSWANGLAFTGGATGWGGQPGGIRQATIDFGAALQFDEVVLFWHGEGDTPLNVDISYWNDSLMQWVVVDSTRNYGAAFESGSNSGYAFSDQYLFSEATSSRVRASFNNLGLSINGSPMVHGWLYEFSVYDNTESIPVPGTTFLMALGMAGLGLVYRKRPMPSQS